MDLAPDYMDGCNGDKHLTEENSRLYEELEQCKADKEFVWSLWKQLQQESPDVTATVDMVVTRERLKQEQRDKEVAMILSVKDEQISTLQNTAKSKSEKLLHLMTCLEQANSVTASLQLELDAQKKETELQSKTNEEVKEENERLQERCLNLEGMFKEKEDACNQLQIEMNNLCQEKERLARENSLLTSKIKSLEIDLSHLKTRLSSLTSAFSVSSDKCHSLQEELKMKDEQLAKVTEYRGKNESTIRQLREELKEVCKSREKWSSDNARQISLIEKLRKEIEELKTALALKEERNQALSKMQNTQLEGNEELPGNQTRNFAKETGRVSQVTLFQKPSRRDPEAQEADSLSRTSKLLENTERELFEIKTQLRAKAEELQCLRCSHDKRLERMKVLKTNYQLVSEQLKTYEKHKSPFGRREGRRKSLKRRHSESGLKHEDSERVWNELAEYKLLYQEMEKQLLLLEEERDLLLARCLRNQTTITELRACLRHEKNDLERKMAAVAALEGSVHSFSVQEQKLVELGQHIEVLGKEKIQLLEKCNDLEKECSIFRQERVDLESKILQLKHESKIKKLKSLCKSTMTEPLEYQGLHSVSQPSFTRPNTTVTNGTTKETSFKHGAKNEPEVIPSKFNHRRSRSEGEVRMSQRKQLQSHPLSCIVTCTSKQIPRGHSLKPTESLASTVFQRNKISNSKDYPQGSKRNVLRSFATQTDAHSSIQLPKVSKGKQERKFVAESHRCAFQLQAKNLEQRLQLVLKKLAYESAARQSLAQSVEEQQSLTEKYKMECKELSQRLQGCRVSLKAVEEGRQKATESLEKLQERVQHLEATNNKLAGRTDSQWRKLEKEKMELQGKCSELRSTTQSVQHDLQTKVTELTLAQGACEKFERDVKQKRLLIEDYQKKLRMAKEAASADRGKMQSLKEDLEKLSDSSEQNKNKVQILRAQLVRQTSDKDKLVGMLEKCQDELDKTIQQLGECREVSDKKVRAVKESFQDLRQEMKLANKERVSKLEVELRKQTDIITEFEMAIEGLAIELEKEFHHLSQSAETATTKTNDVLSTRVREIARSALKLSDRDIDDLFADSSENPEQLHQETLNGDTSPLLRSIVDSTKGYKPPFAVALTTQLMTFMRQETESQS